MNLYRVYFHEEVVYEDYIDASDKTQAKEIFEANLKAGAIIPTSADVIEFEVEKCLGEEVVR